MNQSKIKLGKVLYARLNLNLLKKVRKKVRLGVQNQSESEERERWTTTLIFPRSHTRSMFDFEKLEVYKKAKTFNSGIRKFLKEAKLDPTTNDQLRRASFSIVLNLAEGSGRFSKADRRNFFIIARSSIFECVAILDVLQDENTLEITKYAVFYQQAEELSKIIFAMIANLNK